MVAVVGNHCERARTRHRIRGTLKRYLVIRSGPQLALLIVCLGILNACVEGHQRLAAA